MVQITFDTESSKDWSVVCKICNKRCLSNETMQTILDKKKCSKCGDVLTPGELRHCREHRQELDGILVCFQCGSKK